MPKFDGNKARKDRIAKAAIDEKAAGKQHEPNTYVLGEFTARLPREMPALFAMYQEEGNARASYAELFGPEMVGKFWAEKPTVDDINALNDFVRECYGIEQPGESKPSEDS